MHADLGLDISLAFLCVKLCVFSYLGPSLFTYFLFGVFSPVCFVLSVPVHVIIWKDSSPK